MQVATTLCNTYSESERILGTMGKGFENILNVLSGNFNMLILFQNFVDLNPTRTISKDISPNRFVSIPK